MGLLRDAPTGNDMVFDGHGFQVIKKGVKCERRAS
jgi:hypothetical protein